MKQTIPCAFRFFTFIALTLTFCSACKSTGTASSLQGSGTGTPTGIPSNPVSSAPDPYQQQLLDLINASRATAGLPPYTFSAVESNGTATCVGASGHSIEMSQEGAISHDQFPLDICLPYTSAGENVGYTSGVSENDGILETHVAMMDEGPTGGHYQNIMSSSFTTVGFGLYVDSTGTLWLTEDFIEP
jgi:uncharacterized protein YkwD